MQKEAAKSSKVTAHKPEPFGFGERLAMARKEKKLSGEALGKGLQMGGDASRQTVSDWEKERHYPSVWQLRELCIKLNKTADFLVFGDIKPAAGRALTDEEREVVLRLLAKDGVPSSVIEERMPETKKFKKPSAE